MRCYNGCPDDELAAVWKSRDDAKAEAKRLGYVITYFPVEERYAASRLGDWVAVGPYCNTVEECLHHVKLHYEASSN